MGKTVYIKLNNLKHPERYIHVPVRNGKYVTNAHGFVIPMRSYNGFNTISVEILESDFEQPRTLP